eukprot:2204791-Rhodomonas_salina.1
MGGGASKRGGNSALPTEMIRTRRGERRLPSVLQADGTRLTRASTTPNLGGAPILGGRSSRAESLTQSQDGESLHVMSIRSSLTPVGGRRSEGAAEQIRRIFDEYDVDQSNWWNKEDLDGFARVATPLACCTVCAIPNPNPRHPDARTSSLGTWKCLRRSTPRRGGRPSASCGRHLPLL